MKADIQTRRALVGQVNGGRCSQSRLQLVRMRSKYALLCYRRAAVKI